VVDVLLGFCFKLTHSIVEIKNKSLKGPTLLRLRFARSYLIT